VAFHDFFAVVFAPDLQPRFGVGEIFGADWHLFLVTTYSPFLKDRKASKLASSRAVSSTFSTSELIVTIFLLSEFSMTTISFVSVMFGPPNLHVASTAEY